MWVLNYLQILHKLNTSSQNNIFVWMFQSQWYYSFLPSTHDDLFDVLYSRVQHITVVVHVVI